LRDFEKFTKHLAVNKEFLPGTVIDVGVAWGTPSLYENFPNAYLVLIEALPYFSVYLDRILSKRPGEKHLSGVSDRRVKKTVRVQKNAGKPLWN